MERAQDTHHSWGVQILGHDFDLADWEEVLKPPFDPWVDRRDNEFVLRSARFDALQTPREVSEGAASLIALLNGAMWIARQTRPVHGEGIIEFKPDGTRHRKLIAGTGHFEMRSRAHGVGAAIGSDGKPLPPPPPQQSEVQQWTAIAENEEVLADALVYFSRAEWFDIYKAIECLEDRFGGERTLRQLGWIEDKEFNRLKRTANSFRHREGGTHSPPADPMEQKQALQLLAVMLRRAFATVAS